MQETNNSGSMKSLRQSEITTGRTTALISKTMETATISEQSPVSTQDGGRCSDIRTAWLSMKEERSWPLMVGLTMKIETL